VKFFTGKKERCPQLTGGWNPSFYCPGLKPMAFYHSLNRITKKYGNKEVRIMALLHSVSEAEATGKVKNVFEDIKATKEIDFIPNFWRALANNPDHLEATWQKLKVVMQPGKLDPLTKEIIALAVSITNGCVY
jgi:hypothetical protein